MERFDFLVIGGGIAGLTFALEVAARGTVAVLFKKEVSQSSTSWAQGGIAAVTEADDSVALHQRDTEIAGAGLCNPETVRIVCSEGPRRVQELIGRGTNFDRDSNSGAYHLHQEGGHSRRRIYHTADATGWEIQRSLLAAVERHPNIKLFSHACAIDLITSRKLAPHDSRGPNKVLGAYVLLDSNKIGQERIAVFLARKTLLATGGAGKVYLYTSNPDVATGDGIAMAFRAGARVANMEFFQFHPTCLYHPQAKSFLITEAMRGEGAKLQRIDGTRFMARYHADAELAPRDVVARAIDFEMKTHGDDYVLLDITHRPPEFVREHFPMIYQRCLEYGYDITRQPIPVVPAAHYCCGGVVTDAFARTDLENLYAAGECSHTGLHGANRLASNSLLEGLVFGYRAAQHALESVSVGAPIPEVPAWDPGAATSSDEQVVISQNWDEIRRFMWNYVGIVRTTKRLERALHRSELIEKEIQDYYWNFHVNANLLELRNLSLVANLVIRCALERKESRGLNYNLDFPGMQDVVRDTVVGAGV